MEIRTFSSTYRDGVKRLHEEVLSDPNAFAQHSQWDDDYLHIETRYSRDTGRYLIGVDGGRVLATGALKYSGPQQGEIKEMRVSSQWQYDISTAAQAILRGLEELAVNSNCRFLHLSTAAHLLLPQRLFTEGGYQQIEYEQPDQPQLIFYEKTLPAILFSDIDPTDASAVVTAADYQAFIKALIRRSSPNSTRTLDEYLRALLGLVYQYHDYKVSSSLLAKLWEEAFVAPPLPFDAGWLVNESPRLPGLTEAARILQDDFALMEDLLLYQIADLHRMQQAGQLNQAGHILYMGVKSPTQHTWYNFWPEDFLNASRQTLSSEWKATSWCDLGIMLWLGQIYE